MRKGEEGTFARWYTARLKAAREQWKWDVSRAVSVNYLIISYCVREWVEDILTLAAATNMLQSSSRLARLLSYSMMNSYGSRIGAKGWTWWK